jgi:putative ABC transport system permease protein
MHRFLIRLIGVIVPRRLREEWQREWDAELRHRELRLARRERLDWRARLDLAQRSGGAVWDALSLQRKRLEDEVVMDVRFAARMLFKHKGFTAVAVLSLALGIGANTAIFSVVNCVLLSPLPYRDADRLVTVSDNNAALSRSHTGVSPGNYRDLSAAPGIFENTAAWYVTARTLAGERDAEQVQGAFVTPGFFTTLGVQAVFGTAFSAAQTEGVSITPGNQYVAGDRVVLISDALWRRRFGAAAETVGRTITINGTEWRVQGVMPPEFALPDRNVDLWMPWDLTRTYAPPRFAQTPRDLRFLKTAARLRPGLSPDEAQAKLTSLSAGLSQGHPRENQGWQMSLTPLLEEQVGRVRPQLLVLLAAVAMVLLIACANVASLWLTRATTRQREVAIRAALGAKQFRLARQSLTECLLLALLGGVFGLALANYGLKVLLTLAPKGIPRLDDVAIDSRVLLFTLVVTALSGLATGLLPAWRHARTILATTLKKGGDKGSLSGSSHGFHHGLVIAEIALALVMLVGSGLLTRSFARLSTVEPGFDARNLLTMQVALSGPGFAKKEQAALYYARFLEKTKALPGLESAAAVSYLPMNSVGVDFESIFWRTDEAEPAVAQKVAVRGATPGYFDTLRIPLVDGRDFTTQDRLGTRPVVMVSETFARKVWPGVTAVGKQLTLNPSIGRTDYEVVGVVREVRHYGLRSEPRPEIFIAHAQFPFLVMNVVVRSTMSDPLQLVGAVRQVARELDATQPINQVNTMERLIERSIAPERFALVLLGLLASLAVVLAGVGVYGVLSSTIAARTHEIGVRMVLGASASDVLRMALGQGLRLACTGIGIGLLAAWALTRLMTPLLYGIGATDPLTFAAGALLLTLIAGVACYLPARPATKVDPLVALRHE